MVIGVIGTNTDLDKVNLCGLVTFPNLLLSYSDNTAHWYAFVTKNDENMLMFLKGRFVFIWKILKNM